MTKLHILLDTWETQDSPKRGILNSLTSFFSSYPGLRPRSGWFNSSSIFIFFIFWCFLFLMDWIYVFYPNSFVEVPSFPMAVFWLTKYLIEVIRVVLWARVGVLIRESRKMFTLHGKVMWRCSGKAAVGMAGRDPSSEKELAATLSLDSPVSRTASK